MNSNAIEALCPSPKVICPSEVAFLDYLGASTDDKFIAAQGKGCGVAAAAKPSIARPSFALICSLLLRA
jgi:hypothetical protein